MDFPTISNNVFGELKMTSKDTMDEIEDFLLFNKGSLEKIRAGLKIVGEEEQQLLALRHQLNKVKRIREEQVRKDDQIKKLQEHINLLEYEKTTALRQNSELHQIMSERIETLERHLLDKENTERIHTERLVVLEREVYDKASLEEEIATERKKTKETLAQVEKYREEVKRLKAKSTTDTQLNDHFQALFDNLRQEINAKDSIIADLKQRIDYKDSDFQEEVSSFKDRFEKLRIELDTLKENLVRSERMNANLSEELARRTKENDGLQKLMQETESMMNTFKATTQHEMTQLRSDVQSVLVENETLHQTDNATRALCTAINQQVQSFISLFRDHSEKFELRHLQDIFVELKRLKHSVTDPEPAEDMWAPLLTSFYKLIQLVCEKRNHSLERVKSLENKVTSVDHVATAFHAVEEKFSSVWEDAVVADSIVQGLLEEISQSNLPFKIVHGDEIDNANREDVILSVPKVAKKMTFNNKKITKFHSKRREKDFYELIEYVRQMVARSKDYHAREDLVVYLQQCQAELKDLQTRYANDVGNLQRMSDEAYLAVKVNVVESEKQMDAIRQDCARSYQLQAATLSTENESLQVAVQSLQENMISVVTFVGTLLYMWEDHQYRHRHLSSAYHHSQNLVRGYERLTRDIQKIAQQIQTDSNQSTVASAITSTGIKVTRVSLRTAGIAVIAMIHWRKLAHTSKLQRLSLTNGASTSTKKSHTSNVQSLVTTVTQLRQELASVSAQKPTAVREEHGWSDPQSQQTKREFSEKLCKLTQQLTMTLSDWGLLNHQIVATNDASILLRHLMQRLQARTEQQQQQQVDHPAGTYPSVATLRQRQQQQQQPNAQTSSLLRLLAKPVSYFASSANTDMSFLSTTDQQYLAAAADRKELYCHQEIALIYAKMKEWQARIATLSKKLAAATAVSAANAQQWGDQQSQQQQQQDIVTTRITNELRRTFALELDSAKKAARREGQEEERSRQSVFITNLEAEVATLEERVQEMEQERQRLSVKLQKTHEILRATASHAVQDMRWTAADAADTSLHTAATAANSSIDANDHHPHHHQPHHHHHHSRDKSFSSVSSFAFTAASSTAGSPSRSASSHYGSKYPPAKSTISPASAAAASATTTTPPQAMSSSSIKRSHSFSGGVSVTSSQSTTARYQAMKTAVVSSAVTAGHKNAAASDAGNAAATTAADGSSRYRYLAPETRDYTPLANANNNSDNNQNNNNNNNTSMTSLASSMASSVYPSTKPGAHDSSSEHVPYSLQETHGRDHNYNALDHHQHPHHIYNQGKGHDISPEMHQWTTSNLWQDSSFVSDPSMSAVLSEKPSESDSDSWFLKLRKEDYAGATTTTTATATTSRAPPSGSFSATYPCHYRASTSGNHPHTPSSVLSTPMSKSLVDISGDTLVGYTPEVPDYASRAAQARRSIVDQHKQSQSQSDRELQDIFQDIGRLTARLETRLSHSASTSAASPAAAAAAAGEKARATSVGSRVSGRYQYNPHK